MTATFPETPEAVAWELTVAISEAREKVKAQDAPSAHPPPAGVERH